MSAFKAVQNMLTSSHEYNIECDTTNPLIAIIIPFFNTYETLPQLIKSLQEQTFKRFAAIFVDDGSTDTGPTYIESVARDDTRFMLIQGHHSGPGPARNLGLDKAACLQPSYVTFIDADDTPMPDMLRIAYKTAKESDADIVHYKWSQCETGTPHPDSEKGPSIYVWNKLYRWSTIHNIRFLPIKFAEDLTFFLETEARFPKRVAIPSPLYRHNRHSSSLWESRAPDDVIFAVRSAVNYLSPIMHAAGPEIERRWSQFYLIGLLKLWRKTLRKILRERRDQAIDDYLAFIHQVKCSSLKSFRFILSTLAFTIRIKTKRLVAKYATLHLIRKIRTNYTRSELRISQYPDDRKIRIIFHITDVCKWKCRALYRLLAQNSRYEPMLWIDLTNDELRLDDNSRLEIYTQRLHHFRENHYHVLDGYDIKNAKVIPFRNSNPDVVFYEQPWRLPEDRDPLTVSAYALTCYVPYYVVNYGLPEIDCKLDFINKLWRFFVQNQEYANLYNSILANTARANKCIPVGHPMLDQIAEQISRTTDIHPQGSKKTIIYAPHWTLDNNRVNTLLPIGTFISTGRAMLEYAQSHQDINWVFKPHPLLRKALTVDGGWTEKQVQEYFKSWEHLGLACYDDDYIDLFTASSAMITDCGSFLSEYAATGKPIIHLVRNTNQTIPSGPIARLYETYYRASTIEELQKLLDIIVIKSQDPNHNQRCHLSEELGLLESNASMRIINYLNAKLNRRPING